jgi:hypothetical protein
MGYSVAPVGDLGGCNNTTPIAPADAPSSYLCMNTANTTTPDGRPDIIVSVHRVDTAGLGDVGIALAVDGATGRVMDVYNHPEPQESAIFGFSNYNQPAVGDVGSSTAPDVYQGAMIQTVDKFAQGQGYVLSGDFRSGGANHYRISVLNDPTPNKIGNFGTSSAGVGNVSGDSRNEIMIGAYGPHAPQVIDDIVSDVHIFDPLHDEVLRTIPDPDNQAGSGFGRGLAPLGDLNDDGFIDMVIGAGGFGPGSCSPCPPGGAEPAQGRVYLFTSGDVATPTIDLSASKKKVRKGKKVKLSGSVDAAGNPEACEDGASVKLQRRKQGGGFKRFATATAGADGDYARQIKPKKTREYRASVDASAQCAAAASNVVKVRVKKKKS